jgi:predicted enzyme related to lactoylglutathione lyase
MPSHDHLKLARDMYGAYESGDRGVVEEVLSDDFTFADAAAATAAELSGRVVVEPHDTPGFREAVLADPQGAVFSVSQLLMGT